MEKNQKYLIIGLLVLFVGCLAGSIVTGAILMVANTSKSESQDAFSKSGPYTSPIIKNGRFTSTPAFARGIGKVPVEFSIAIPKGKGWKTDVPKKRGALNFVQFLKYNDKGGELAMFAIGHYEHNPPYNSNVLANKSLTATLAKKFSALFTQQFEAKGLVVKQADKGWYSRDGRYEHRVDLTMSGWFNKNSPKGPYLMSLILRPRLDHKPHGVVFIIASHQNASAPNHDAMIQKGLLADTLKSFKFEK